MMNAIFAAILRELMLKYPGLAWASIYTQVLDAFSHLGPGPREEFDRWWMTEMDIPCPGMEGQPQGPPSGDPLMP